MIKKTKVFVLGLDCASPSIIFDQSHHFPTLRYLLQHGVFTKMRAPHPPITVPAWMSMCTGQDPGSLGLYGFRHRHRNSYNDITYVQSYDIKKPKIWDYIKKYNKRSILVGIPPSYPPYKIHGKMVSCFMTPTPDSPSTYPRALQKELTKKFGILKTDIVFRTNKRDQIVKDLYSMTHQHFQIINYLQTHSRWDFFMSVEIGVDRIHHAFWKYHDPHHFKYVKNSPYKSIIIDYYKYLDTHIAKILKSLDKDTIFLLASDHGAKAMKGCFCINEWLIKKGYLVLHNYPKNVVDIDQADIDWKKTIAWGWGGYYARIFLNMKSREAQGIIPTHKYYHWRRKLIRELQALQGPAKQKWANRVYHPDQLYPTPTGNKPDLMVYFDNLSWRSAGSIGYKKCYLDENDTGVDDAVHDWNGILIAYSQTHTFHKLPKIVHNQDFAPTVLSLFGVTPPKTMRGKNILRKV